MADCPRACLLLASRPKGRGKGLGERGVSDTDITRLLALARDGEPAQLGAVFEALYPELRRLANSRMYGNESTFTPTVLVHELFLRITQGSPLALADRNHFFAASAKAMRRNFCFGDDCTRRSEEHTSELQSLMRISYDVFCLK